MDWCAGIAMQLMLLCRKDNGRLTRDGVVEATLRVGLLLDLLFDGRIEQNPAAGESASDRCGFAPADLVLHSIEADPGRNLNWWIGHGPRVRAALAQEWVEAGRWSERAGRAWSRSRRYQDVSDPLGGDKAALRDELRRIADDPIDATPHQATLAAAAQIGGLIDDGVEIPSDQLLDACGEARWLVAHTVAFMAYARAQDGTPSSLAG